MLKHNIRSSSNNFKILANANRVFYYRVLKITVYGHADSGVTILILLWLYNLEEAFSPQRCAEFVLEVVLYTHYKFQPLTPLLPSFL